MTAIRHLNGQRISAKGLKPVQQFPFTHGIDVGNVKAVKNNLLSPLQAAYCVAHRSTINPQGKPYSVVYGASGPDIATPLLSCDPKMIVCIDKLRLHRLSLESALAEWGTYTEPNLAQELKIATKHRHDKYFWFGGTVDEHFERLIMTELKKLGVNSAGIKIEWPNEKQTDIYFRWAYPGEKAKERTVRYYHNVDLTAPAAYPAALKELVEEGFDGYYQKSSENCIIAHNDYLPYIIRGARKWVLVSPTPSPMQGIEINENVWQFLGQHHAKVNNINDKYEPMFRELAQSRSSDADKYSWYMELWARLAGK